MVEGPPAPVVCSPGKDPSGPTLGGEEGGSMATGCRFNTASPEVVLTTLKLPVSSSEEESMVSKEGDAEVTPAHCLRVLTI